MTTTNHQSSLPQVLHRTVRAGRLPAIMICYCYLTLHNVLLVSLTIKVYCYLHAPSSPCCRTPANSNYVLLLLLCITNLLLLLCSSCASASAPPLPRPHMPVQQHQRHPSPGPTCRCSSILVQVLKCDMSPGPTLQLHNTAPAPQPTHLTAPHPSPHHTPHPTARGPIFSWLTKETYCNNTINNHHIS